MDDIVRQAMSKWPHVPDCYGWLGLDARGNWFLRDAAIQSAGGFPSVKGDRLEHANLCAFIGRNYLADSRGCWYFQNGPQRVFLELESTPWILRVDEQGRASTHTGECVQPRQCLQDENGRVYLGGAYGVGLVHSLDVSQVAVMLEQGLWTLQDVREAELPTMFQFVRSPQALMSQVFT